MEIKEIKATRSLTDRNRLSEKHVLRVAPYCRVSTDKDDQLHSYHSQLKYYTDLVNARDDWMLVEVYADEGITGTMTKKRESFQNMINDCLDGRIDMIITKSISRFARNTLDTLKYVRMLKEKNIAVFFEEENINTLTMDGELLLTILSSVAQQEVENLSENVKKGLKMKMRRGELVGFQGCMGYDYDPETKQISVNKEEAEIVKHIFKRYTEGAGGTIISRELNEMGVKTFKGADWTAHTVIGIIKNEKYKGDLLLGKTFTVDPISKKRLVNYGEEDRYYITNHHEAIITAEMFDEAQEILQYRSKSMSLENDPTERTKYSRKYPFSSKIQCAYCGQSYTRRTWHSNTRYKKTIWGCISVSKFAKDFCLKSKGIPEEVLQEAFVESYKLLYGKNKKLVDEFLTKAEESLGKDAMSAFYKKAMLDLEKVKAKKKRLVELHINDHIDADTYNRKYEALDAKISELEQFKDSINEWELHENILKNRLIEFRRVLEESTTIDQFDPHIFNCLCEKIIVGGTDEEGNDDPYKITFVYKTGFESVYTGYKGRRRMREKINKELPANHDDDPLIDAVNRIFDTRGDSGIVKENKLISHENQP